MGKSDCWIRQGTRPGSAKALLFMAALLFFLSGCSPKTQVVYIPMEKRNTGTELSVSDKETVLLLKRHYERWRGTPYVDGGMSASGMDCSGFTVVAFRELFGVSLPRTAGEQAVSGREVTRDALKPGDLVFFQTGRWKRHVGIYLSDEQFIHASLSRGVTLSSLDDSYWQKKYWQARRLSSQNQLSLNRSDNTAVAYR